MKIWINFFKKIKKRKEEKKEKQKRCLTQQIVNLTKKEGIF